MQEYITAHSPRTGAGGVISLLNFLGTVCAGVRCTTGEGGLLVEMDNEPTPGMGWHRRAQDPFDALPDVDTSSRVVLLCRVRQ